MTQILENIKQTTTSLPTNVRLEDMKLSKEAIPQKEKISISVLREIISNESVIVKLTRPVINTTGKTENEILHSIQLKFEFPIDLFGEEFRFSQDSEGCYIYHPKWALIGEGKNLQEAKDNLIITIHHLRENYAKTRIEQLDSSGIEFREYLLSIQV